MTSGNVSDEPIAFENEDALERLAGIADLFLLHDRPIHTRTDDSVVRGGRIVRRSRGYVPATFPVADGAAAARGRRGAQEHVRARPRRPRVGRPSHRRPAQLRDAALLHRRHRALRAAVRGHARTRRARPAPGVPLDQVRARARPAGARGPAPPRAPRRVPGRARRRARGRRDLRRHRLRHRRHRLGRRAAARRPDVASSALGHLWPVRMPGGEAAIREPWRMACAWLGEIGVAEPLPGIDPARWAQVAELARTGLASPVTTSMGRLFDAVAALCGVRHTVTYEGQAAIELEAARRPARDGRVPARRHAGTARRRAARRRRALAAAAPSPRARPRRAPHHRRRRARPGARRRAPLIAARFHNAVANATAEALRDEPVVVLSGGVFQNELLLARTLRAAPARARPRGACRSTTAASPTARPRSLRLQA